MRLPIEIKPLNGGVPLRFFLTPEMMPDKQTVAQLEDLAQTQGLKHYVAVLPDIHRKHRNLSPTGTVIAAKDVIVPPAVDTGINCGMSMIRTDVDVSELTTPVLDSLFDELMRTIPVLQHDHDIISPENVADILAYGGKWSQIRFGLSDQELDCIEDRATMPTDTTDVEAILASMPAKAIKKGPRCFGTLGDGNHFLELQEIVDVFDRTIAKALGLFQGQAFIMLHTGSRSLGSKMMKAYLKELQDGFRAGQNGLPIWSMPADSEEGIRYARAVSAASNFGFANRIAIREKLRTAMRTVLHDQSLQMPLLYDCAHVSIKPENCNGERLWVHRHGASRALPPSQFSDHPLFSKTGQPVPIPGSMGHHSFVGVANEIALDTYCSVNHGAGRVLDKPEAAARFTGRQVESELRLKNIRLYRYGSGDIAEQAPSSFKDISQVIEAMYSLSLARPVVRLRPVAVLK
jgi:tRNA-splicing ligase RtcB